MQGQKYTHAILDRIAHCIISWLTSKLGPPGLTKPLLRLQDTFKAETSDGSIPLLDKKRYLLDDGSHGYCSACVT